MKQEAFTYLSTDARTTRSASFCTPDEPAQAVLLILHDAEETAARYAALTGYLREAHIATVFPFFAEYGAITDGETRPNAARSDKPDRVITADLALLRKEIQTRFPDVPLFALGTGTGSLLLISFLVAHGAGFNGVVLAGTSHLSPGSCSFKLYSIGALSSLRSDAYRQGILPRKVKLSAAAFSCNETNIAKLPKNLAVFFVSGADDPDGDFGAGVRRMQEKMLTSGMPDVACTLYPRVKHDLLQEPFAELYFEDLLSFIKTHTGENLVSSYDSNKAYEEKKAAQQQEYEIEQILL